MNHAVHRVWLLRLVLPGRWGRWCTGLLILALMIGIYRFGGVFGQPEIPVDARLAALFFCVITAYVVPTYHYITERTLVAFDVLAPRLELVEEQLSAPLAVLREGIDQRPVRWHLAVLGGATLLWLAQSWLLAGSGSALLRGFTSGSENRLMLVGPLVVWCFTATAVLAQVKNAQLFREFARTIPINLLDVSPLMAFGRMAVTATLVMLGSLASFSLLWLGGANSLWATLPGFLLAVAAMWYLLFVPITPLHTRLSADKHTALVDLQHEISAATPEPLVGAPTDKLARLNSLLGLRQELLRVPEWPFDLHVLARLGLYIVIVPLTWVGAALIENLVDLVLG